jgi:acyl carrier protein
MHSESALPHTNIADREGALLRIVRELIDELHPEAGHFFHLTLDSSLDRDLGLNSLARMELLTRLEREFSLALSLSLIHIDAADE